MEFLKTHHDRVIVYQPRVDLDLTKYFETQDLRFDHVFGGRTSTETVYKSTAQPLVRTVFERHFAACFAFGQTGSGKTHTMNGDYINNKQDYANSIYAMTASDILRMQQCQQYSELDLTVSCSFFEVDGGRICDLLKNKASLRVLEAGKKIQVVGMQEVPITSESDVLHLIEKGTLMRTTHASTTYNSSKSHAIFQIILRRNDEIWGKFSLIDLASDEFDEDSSSSKRTRGGGEVNKSLLALKECIRAVASNNSYVPFRNSKLTLVLRDSFVVAKARICLIATISPGMSASKRTISTLRFAQSIKTLVEERENFATKKEDIGGNNNSVSPEEEPSVSHENNAVEKEVEEDDNSSSLSRNLSVSTLTAATNGALNIRHILDQCVARWIEEIRMISSSTDDNEEKLIRLIISANRMSSGLSKFVGMLNKWQELREQNQTPPKKK